jgi:hypothetical protein
VGLLINFNVKVLKDGIRRVVNDFPDSPRAGADSAVNKYHIFMSFPPKYSISKVVGILKAVSAREILKGVSESEEGVMGAVAVVLKIPVPEGRGFLLAGRRLVIPRRRGEALPLKATSSRDGGWK